MDKSQLAKQIGRKIAEAREQAELSRSEVGKQLGLSERGYGHIEAGRSLITLDHLIQLPRILGKPLSYFLPIHAFTEAELNDLTHDPRVQDILDIWRFLTDIGHEPGLDALHKLALAFHITHEAKRKPEE